MRYTEVDSFGADCRENFIDHPNCLLILNDVAIAGGDQYKIKAI